MNCAVEVQKLMAARNAEVADDRKMLYRIGVNLGDVMVDGDDIFGDGVNVAARLQEVSETGGIAISDIVRGQVHDKLDVAFADDGDQQFKNIAQPVHVWRWPADERVSAAATASIDEPSPLPDKPSIAVLPFNNMSGDPEQDYFSDGISEDLITELSKIPGLFVMARHSSFAYKGQAADVKRISNDLGVRYLLEGSVRRAGSRVRINAQLIDAATGGHVWADRYDRDLEDIFALQDEVIHKIIHVLMEKFGRKDMDVAEHDRPANIKTYDLVLRGRELYHRYTAKDNIQAKEFLKKATELDPSYAQSYIWLGFCHWIDWQNDWSKSGIDLIDSCYEVAIDAVRLDPREPLAHLILGVAHFFRRDRELALKAYQEALRLQPDQPDVLAHYSELLTCDGHPNEGIQWLRKAMRLNPHYPGFYSWFLGLAQYAARQYEDAVKTLREAPQLGVGRRILAASLGQLGRVDEARAEAQEFLKGNPNFSAQFWASTEPFEDEADGQHFVEGYLKAGLPA